MTKSELFKAAHKLAKAYQFKMGGDYAAYLSLALKKININKKMGLDSFDVFSKINKAISNISCELALITKKDEVTRTHGLKEFKATYELNKAEKELGEGKFFGKSFSKNGMVCAWVKSVSFVETAY